MAIYEYKTWAGRTRRLEADWIEFAPSHVVFRRQDYSIVRAEANSDVNGLTQLREDAGS